MVDGLAIDWDVPIAMDDGVVLRADVYRPADPGRYPVLMNLGPYGKGYAFADYAPIQWRQLTTEHPEVTHDTSNRYAQWETVDPEKWVPHGYTIVRVDARGTGRSPGFMDPWSARERRDYYACIEWAAHQGWCNGKVGLSGISYHAANQWMVATLRPPHLAAICVWEGMADFYRDAARHGGILCNFWLFWIKKQAAKMQHGLGSRSARSRETGALVTGDEELDDETLARNRSSFEHELRDHELDAPFYRERSADPAQIAVPLLSAGNWGGAGRHLRGNVENFVGAASPQKWLEIHGLEHWTEYFTTYGVALQRRFFDHFLKGADNGWDREPRVRLHVRHTDGLRIRDEHEWPLARTRWTNIFLHPADRSLRTEPPTEDGSVSFDGFQAGVTFFSPPLEAQLEITGPVAVKLWISSSTNDADLFLVLRAFDPHGDEVVFAGATDPHAPVGQGWLRASHRKLDTTRSLPYRPFHTHDEKWPLRQSHASPQFIANAKTPRYAAWISRWQRSSAASSVARPPAIRASNRPGDGTRLSSRTAIVHCGWTSPSGALSCPTSVPSCSAKDARFRRRSGGSSSSRRTVVGTRYSRPIARINRWRRRAAASASIAACACSRRRATAS